MNKRRLSQASLLRLPICFFPGLEKAKWFRLPICREKEMVQTSNLLFPNPGKSKMGQTSNLLFPGAGNKQNWKTRKSEPFAFFQAGEKANWFRRLSLLLFPRPGKKQIGSVWTILLLASPGKSKLEVCPR